MKVIIFIIAIFIVSFLSPLILGSKTSQFIPFIIAIIGVAYQLIVNRNEGFSRLGFSISSPRIYAFGFLMICFILAIIMLSGTLTGGLRPKKGLEKRDIFKLIFNLAFSAIFIGIIATFTEELVFRGIIQRYFSISFSPLIAILLSSAIFGIWHLPVGKSFGLDARRLTIYIFGTGLVGVIFGKFYYESKSLFVCGFIHGVWNAISYTFFGLDKEIPGLFISSKDWLTHPEYGILGICGLILGVVLSLLLFP